MPSNYKNKTVPENRLRALISAYTDLRSLHAELTESRVIAPEILEKVHAIKLAVGSALEFISEQEREVPQDSVNRARPEEEARSKAKGRKSDLRDEG